MPAGMARNEGCQPIPTPLTKALNERRHDVAVLVVATRRLKDFAAELVGALKAQLCGVAFAYDDLGHRDPASLGREASPAVLEIDQMGFGRKRDVVMCSGALVRKVGLVPRLLCEVA